MNFLENKTHELFVDIKYLNACIIVCGSKDSWRCSAEVAALSNFKGFLSNKCILSFIGTLQTSAGKSATPGTNIAL